MSGKGLSIFWYKYNSTWRSKTINIFCITNNEQRKIFVGSYYSTRKINFFWGLRNEVPVASRKPGVSCSVPSPDALLSGEIGIAGVFDP
jgi:hypothetical protein